MIYLAVGVVAFLASGLTFFSGFGLGTLLLPAFALYFSIELAVAMTALIHFLNNLFKLLLIGKQMDRRVLLVFGGPALLAAFAGAMLLVKVATIEPVFRYTLLGRAFSVSPLSILIGVLMIFFAFFELAGLKKRWHLPRKWLPLGGLLSGFFGGLSGHQGAFRSLFLLHAGLTKEAFIATGIGIACMVDMARLAVYGSRFFSKGLLVHGPILAVALGCAFAGAFLGRTYLKKMTLKTIQIIVAVLLFGIGLGMGLGFLS